MIDSRILIIDPSLAAARDWLAGDKAIRSSPNANPISITYSLNFSFFILRKPYNNKPNAKPILMDSWAFPAITEKGKSKSAHMGEDGHFCKMYRKISTRSYIQIYIAVVGTYFRDSANIVIRDT